MKNKLKSILSIEIPFLYLKKTLALVLIAGMVLTNGDFALLGHTVVEAAASSFKANGTSVDLNTPEPWQAMANAKNNITDKSGVSQSVLGKAWLYGVVANEWNFDGESETNFAVKTLSGKAGQTGVTDKAKGDLSAESMVGESTTNGVVQIKGVPETLTLPEGQESKFFDSCNGLIYKYDTKENIEAAIDAMRSHVAQQSADMAQKNSIPDYSKVARGDSAQKITLDFTESPEGTIYVNVDQWVVNSQWEVNDWSLSQAFKENGAITIKKKSNQIIVFNFSGSEVNLNKMIIEEGGKSQDTVGIANTPSSSKDIIEGLYFNMPNATKVHLQDSAGIFIAPKATVTTGGVGGGWLICDKLINGCEWHFTNGKLPDTYGKDSVQFHAVKNIAGKPASKDGFTFTLSEKDENKWNTIQTKTNKGSAIDFDSIEYKYDTKNPDQEVKLYRISEAAQQTLDGVTYNAEKTDYYARVTLDKTSAAGQGHSNNYSVKASVAYYKDEACSQLIDTEAPVFNNTEANGSLLVLKSVSGPEGFKLTDAQKQAIVFTVSDSSGATIASFTYKNMLHQSGVTLPNGSVVKVTYEEGGVKLSNLTPGSYTVSEKVDQANDVAGYAHTTTVTVDGKEKTTNSGTVKVESAKDASIAFKNSYAQASVELKGTKTIDGNKPQNQEFAFSLYEASKNGKDFKRGDDPIQTVRNDGEGNFRFSTITYSKAGTYYYFILEEDPSQDAEGQETGIKKNIQKYLVTVVVQKNRDGSLTAEAPSYQEMASITTNGKSTKPSNTAAFKNTTERSEGSISLSAKKELIGRGLKAGEFTFELVAADQDGKPITENGKEVILQSVKNGVKKADGSNNIQFEKITYQKDLYSGIDQRGTYYYIVREKQGTDSHIAYTKVTYLVRVNVTDSKTDGKLEVEKSIQLLSDGTSNETAKATNTNKENIEFVNTYSASGSITISGKKTVNGKAIDDQAQSISGAKNQEFIFRLDQMAKDGAKASEKSDGLHRTAKTNASGRFTFDKIPYTLDDAGNTYYYKLSEDTSKLQAGYSKDFDDQYISVKVEKSNKDDGTLELTISSKTYDKDGKVKKSDGATINVNGADYTYDAGNLNNKYAASTSVKLHGNKTINGQKPSKDVTDKFSFKLSLLEWRDASGSVHTQKDDTYRQTVKTDNYSQTVKTDKDGNFSFKPLAFYLDDEHNQIGTYKYQIEEVDVPEGYSVNTSAQIVIVKIEDNGKGQLVATMTDEKGKAIKADLEKNSYIVKGYTFDNTYHASEELNLSGTKTLIGKDLKQGDFKFTLRQTDKDGKELTDGYSETVSNAAPSTDMGANANGSTAGFAFRAIEYTEADAGKDFYYTVSEQAGDQAGITYDGKVYQIHVKVTDNGDGTLKVERKDDVKQISFTNFYNASASLNLNLIKTINGKTVDESHVANLKDKKFTFTLTEMNGKGEKASPKKNGKTETITVSGKDGKASFSPLSYTLADRDQTYYYRIAEDASTSKMPKGFAKDGKDFYFSITVSDDGSGLLHLTSDSDAINDGMDGNTFTAKYALGHTFNNTYSASGELPVKGNKTINGLSPDKNVKDLFEFTLTEISVNDVPVEKPYTETVKTDKDGKFSFTSLKYSMNPDIANSPSGSVKYIYQIEETSYPKGYTKDTDPEYLEVTVSDHGDGTLSIQSTEPEAGYTFNNLYDAKGSITLKGKKTLHGRDMAADEFHFTVTETDDKGTALKVKNAEGKEVDKVVARGSNAAASKDQAAAITFDPITYDSVEAVGTHTYEITEDPFQGAAEDGSKDGLQANSQKYIVQVEVSDNGDGTLKAEAISGTDADGETIDPATGIAFINTYEASGDHSFYGTKTVAGRDLTPGEDYQFQVEEVITDEDGKENRVEVSTGHLNPDTIVGNHGDILFGTLHYTLADVGTHTYKIHEVIPADQDKMAGISYDKTEYTEIVTVSDKGDGSLEVVAKDADGNLINSGETKTYNFTNTYQNVAVRFTGSKTLAGGDIASYPGAFRFDLVDSDGQVIDTAKNDATGRFTFAPIYYEASDVGEHTYTIVEENAGRIINGIKYDDSEIPVTVSVENRAGKLVATGQVEGDEIAFHNEKLSEITVQKNWADDQNAANARPQQITVDLLQNEQVVRSAVLTGATDTWTYTFKDLTPGTYKVRERSDSPYYEVSYDKQILDLTDENGQAKDETVTITNTFERTVDLVAYKDLIGQALNDGQFRFNLHRNSDGDDTSHDLTTTNRGNGSISFYDVTYDPNGYTMYEVAEQSKYPHITFDEHNSIATGLRFDPEGNPITQEDGTALYTFKNVYRPIVLRVQKRSKSAPFDPLVGATYGLYRYSADGNDVLVEAQLSDSNGYMYYGKIEPGVIYYFKEISAPAGHEVDPYAGKHFQVKYTENGNIAVYDEDGNLDTTYGDITTMEDKTEGYRTTEIIKEKDSLDEIQANEKQSRYAYTGNGVDAVAIADKGAFPEGTTMVVTPLTGDRLAEVETLLENNVGQFNTMAFYDITFTDADGKEVEPAFGDVDVTIQPEVGLDTKGIELKNLKLIHLIDDGDPESTVKTVSLVTGSIAAEEKDGEEKLTQTKITSKSFSVFGLIDPKDSTLGNNYLLTANGVGDFVSKLKVAKLDTQGNFIPNATLDVYTFDPKKKDGIGERVIRWTTAEGCQYLQRILNVETPYVLVETNAPDGYAIADNIIFSIGKYDSSITCYTLKDGKLTASEKETQLHTNGSELIMVDDPITVMNKTDYKIIPQVKELTRDREITVLGAPKTGDQPIIPLVVILLAGIIGFAGIEIEKRRKNREEKQK